MINSLNILTDRKIMNISNNKFDSAKSVGIISNTLNKIDSSDKTINCMTINCSLANFIN